MAKTLTCLVVTPEQTALEQQADSVVLPLYDGEIGIFPGHAPLIGRMGYGEMRISTGGVEQNYYVDGGFVQVADNIVSVLTNRALPADKLDVAAAKTQLETVMRQPANSDEALDLRDREVAQLRALIKTAKRR